MVLERDTFVAFSDALFERNPLPMWVYDPQTLRFLSVNDAAVGVYGYSREEFLAMTLLDIRPVATTGGWHHTRRDGTIINVEVANSYRIPYGGGTAIVAIVFDVTERNQRFLGLEAHRAVVQEAHELGRLGTFILDVREGTLKLGGTLVRAYGRSEMPVSEAASEVARVWHPDDSNEARRLLESLERFECYDGEFRMHVDGEARWFHGRTNVMHAADATVTGIIGIAVDVTDRKHEAERLRAIAFSDAATGLPNRAALLEDTATRDGVAALVLVRVRSVAETSQRCDQARARAAQTIAAMLRKLAPDARLFRFSEETFAFATPRTERLRVPLPLARRIVAAFERPLSVGDDEFVVIPTIGIAVSDGSDGDLAELSRRAEAALHEAARSDNAIAVYTAEMTEAHDRRATIERNLRHAVVERRIGVVYQPIVSLRSGRFTGVEALMRWDCPGIGSVPPSEFIEVAEESGVIVRLGDWILREACRQMRSWQLDGNGHLRIAVNVAARQVQQREFFRSVMTACEAVGLAPSDLELELTERAVMQPGGLALRNMEALRRAGVRISVDDFGTGYSALSYLATLPLDAIKLDRSLVSAIAGDSFHAEIASSVIALAHRRGLSVVGEGVEAAAQQDGLRGMGCDEAQGYLFSRPVEANDLASLLRLQGNPPRHS